jgi:DNA-binding ferritin-like protein (Dps family)
MIKITISIVGKHNQLVESNDIYILPAQYTTKWKKICYFYHDIYQCPTQLNDTIANDILELYQFRQKQQNG